MHIKTQQIHILSHWQPSGGSGARSLLDTFALSIMHDMFLKVD